MLQLLKNIVVCLLVVSAGHTAVYTQDKAAQQAVRVLENVRIPMRDGVATLAEVYLPKGEGPFPVILSRVPYGTKSEYIGQYNVGRFWAAHGYAYVAQNVRGRFGSEGRFGSYHNQQEERDGYDTVDWITKQPWSNDRVGLVGESYYGYTSLAGAHSGHPAVKSISPANITIAREKQVLDGAFPIQASGLWTLNLDDIEKGQYQDTDSLNIYHLPLITMGEAHGLRDVMWRRRVTGYLEDPLGKLADADKYYAKIRVPALHVTGWYDSFTRGSIAIWDGVRRLSENQAVRGQQWLMIGPWDHENMSENVARLENSNNRVGPMKFDIAIASSYEKALVAFFDYTLKEKDNGFAAQPIVQYFNIGANEWRFADTWPPKEMQTKSLYLHSAGKAVSSSDGSLNMAKPEGEEPVDVYDYDPLKPVNITEKIDVWHRGSNQMDRSELLGRGDVLTYMTDPLEEELDITGPIKLELYASSSAVDTDFTGALVHVFPDGFSLLIQEGLLRASFRDKSQNPTPIEPGKVYKFDIDMWATSYTVPKGHKLRLEVSSSNFPRFARNLNNGETFGMSDQPVVATQTIYHSKEYPSKLVLPFLPK